MRFGDYQLGVKCCVLLHTRPYRLAHPLLLRLKFSQPTNINMAILVGVCVI